MLKPITCTAVVVDHEATGELIRGIRKIAKLNASEVARAACISLDDYNALERGDKQWTGILFDKVIEAMKDCVP